MTSKNISTGQITVSPDALLPNLETTEIKAGENADPLWTALAEARRHLSTVALMLPFFSDASRMTLKTICEADEILINIKARISPEDPTTTSIQRDGK
jgi:hypothetical protein